MSRPPLVCRDRRHHDSGKLTHPDDISALLDNSSVRKPEIEARLAAIDIAKVRPLTAMVGGTATEFDTRKLAELEAEAAELRAELAKL